MTRASSSIMMTANFTRLLFECDSNEIVEYLNSKVDSDVDHVLQCLTAWQDLVDSSQSPLRVLLDCFEDDEQSANEAARLLLALVGDRDELRATRIRKELIDLGFASNIESIADRHRTASFVQSLHKFISNEFHLLDEADIMSSEGEDSALGSMEEVNGPRPSTAGPPPPPPPGPPPPPPPPGGLLRAGGNVKKVELPPALRPKRVADDSKKHKKLMWAKLGPNAVVGGQSVWSKLARETQGLSLDFDLIDGFFTIQPKEESAAASKLPATKKTIVELLTQKRSQNVTIMIKQFKDLNALLNDIETNGSADYDISKLKTLKKIEPEKEEIEALRNFDGDEATLSIASSFLRHLIAIPHYSLRIDLLVFQSEYPSVLSEVKTNMETMLQACHQLVDSPSLRRFFLVLVHIGNYLNGSSPQGNAAGFRLNSLCNILDAKTNQRGTTLLHVIDKMEPHLAEQLQEELSSVDKAADVSLDLTRNELSRISEEHSRLLKALRAVEEKEPLADTIPFSENDCSNMLLDAKELLSQLEAQQSEVADFFCEDKNSFKMKDCLLMFKSFLSRFSQASQENNKSKQKTNKTAASEVRKEEVSPAESITVEKSPIASKRRASVLSTEVKPDEDRRLRPMLQKDTATRTPANKSVSHRPRQSIHYENSSNLTEFIECLQNEKSDRRGSMRRLHSMMSVSTTTLTSQSSSATTSPKSRSDESSSSDKENCERMPTSAPAEPRKDPKDLAQPAEAAKMKKSSPPTRTMTTIRVTTQRQPSQTDQQSVGSKPPSTPSTPTSRTAVTTTSARSRMAAVVTKRQSSVPTNTSSTSKPALTSRTLSTDTVKRPDRTERSERLERSDRSNPRMERVGSKPELSGPTRPTATQRRAPPLSSRAMTTVQRSVTTAPPKRASVTEGMGHRVSVSSQVSTTSRPSIIRTGSTTQRNLFRMETFEKAKPLRKSDAVKKASAPKPKWV